MGFTNLVREIGDQGHRLDAIWYIGIVVDNNDPKKQNRVRVRSRDYSRNVEDDDLPWCAPAGAIRGNTSKGVGEIDIPPIGSRVIFTYQRNDQYYPVYVGGCNFQEDLKLTEFTEGDFGGSYPNVRGWVDRSGNFFAIDTKRDVMQFTHVSGTTILIDGKGHVKIQVADHAVGPDAAELTPKGVTFEIQGDLVTKVSGKITIDAQQDIDFATAGNISFNAQGNTNITSLGDIILAGSNILENSNSPSPRTPSNPSAPAARERPEEDSVANQTDY